MKYLELFFNKLNKDGFIILENISLEKGFCNTFEELRDPLKKLGFLLWIRVFASL